MTRLQQLQKAREQACQKRAIRPRPLQERAKADEGVPQSVGVSACQVVRNIQSPGCKKRFGHTLIFRTPSASSPCLRASSGESIPFPPVFFVVIGIFSSIVVLVVCVAVHWLLDLQLGSWVRTVTIVSVTAKVLGAGSCVEWLETAKVQCP